MDNGIKCHIIARTPVQKKNLIKLSSKKSKFKSLHNVNDQNNDSKECTTDLSSFNNLINNSYITMRRPLCFTSPVLPLNFSSDDSTLKISQNCKTSTSNNSSDKSVEESITPEMVKLLDSFYGDEWRSTPGLFKKKKVIKYDKDVTKNEDTDIINKISELNIENNRELEDTTNFFKNNVEILKETSTSNSVIPLNDILFDNQNDNKLIKSTKLDFEDCEQDNEIFDKENIQNPLEKKEKLKKSKLDKNKQIENSLENTKKYSFMASLTQNIPSWRSDLKAKYYKDNFKAKKDELAAVLFKMFNENVFDSQICVTLSIVWSKTLRTTAGRTYNKKVYSKSNNDIQKTSRIELSSKIIDNTERLRNTLVHEMCHVATWIIDGDYNAGHGPLWKAWTVKVLKKYPEIKKMAVCHSYEIHFKFTYKCIKCGYKINRHSKSIDITLKRCGYCYGMFECILNRKLKDGLIVSTPARQHKELNGFALYVKENYNNVRSCSTPHKEAMKYLGKQYAKMKMGTEKINDCEKGTKDTENKN